MLESNLIIHAEKIENSVAEKIDNAYCREN